MNGHLVRPLPWERRTLRPTDGQLESEGSIFHVGHFDIMAGTESSSAAGGPGSGGTEPGIPIAPPQPGVPPAPAAPPSIIAPPMPVGVSGGAADAHSVCATCDHPTADHKQEGRFYACYFRVEAAKFCPCVVDRRAP
jgi:hypothetical protein